jgi:hypothetical protein
MQDLSRYLFLAGALPFLALGIAHALMTPRRPGQDKGLSPLDPGLAQAMARSPIRLTRRTDVWRGWVGFNLSHSLGAMLLGTLVVLVARSPASFESNAAVFVPLAVVVSIAYLAIGLAYWFRSPIIGIGLSVSLFSAARVFHHLGR